jgi:branched-chain amino acid transport system ATP-binding protein
VLTSAAEPLLSVGALESGYGKIRVLHGIDIKVASGEVVALLGPNGAGKTTMLRALSGLLPVTAGQVRFDGRDITNTTPREAARAGLVHVIEGHRIFTQISVTDNLLLAGYDLPRGALAARV